MKKMLYLFSPSLVLAIWAGLVALGLEGIVVKVAALLLLAVALPLHLRAEKERHRVI